MHLITTYNLLCTSKLNSVKRILKNTLLYAGCVNPINKSITKILFGRFNAMRVKHVLSTGLWCITAELVGTGIIFHVYCDVIYTTYSTTAQINRTIEKIIRKQIRVFTCIISCDGKSLWQSSDTHVCTHIYTDILPYTLVAIWNKKL